MKTFSREQQLANIDLAERLWKERVRPEQVYPGLALWCEVPDDCGSLACFGGWLVRFPEFRAMGLHRAREVGNAYSFPEAPALDTDTGGFGVSAVLFGDPNLFEPRSCHPADPGYVDEDYEGISDHQLVLNRLQHARENLLNGEA